MTTNWDAYHFFDSAEHLFRQGVRKGWFTGWQYAIQQGGEPMLTKCGGLTSSSDYKPYFSIEDDTLFDCSSVTKSLPLALMVLHLVSDGLISLTDPVTKFISTLKAEGDVPTIKDLLAFGVEFDLNHLVNYQQYKPAYLHRQITGSRLWRSKFKYSNYASYLLARIVELCTGQAFAVMALDCLLRPLGLVSATFFPKNTDQKIAATEVVDGVPLQGVVHDPLARAIGPVNSGISGLFASAKSLCILMGVSRDGLVAGRQFIKPELLKLIGQNHVEGCVQSGLGFGLVTQLMQGFSLPHACKQDPDLFTDAFFRSGFSGCVVAYVPRIDLTMTATTNVLHPNQSGREHMSLFRHVLFSHFVGGTSDMQILLGSSPSI